MSSRHERDELLRSQIRNLRPHDFASASFEEWQLDDDDAAVIAGELKEHNTTATKLCLYKHNIGSAGAMAFSEMLMVNTTLHKLILWGIKNKIGVACALAMAEAVAANATLKVLGLGCHKFGRNVAVAFAQALTKNGALRVLGLQCCELCSKSAKILAGALLENSTLQELDLSPNTVGDEGAVAFAAALEVNKSLKVLKIGDSIGDNGAVAFAAALEVNKSLKVLKIGMNIGDKGGVVLAQALVKNSTLQELDLGHNNIGSETAVAFAEALMQNATLRKLCLSYAMIGNAGSEALALALAGNTSLQALYVDGNDIGDVGALAIAEALTSNTALQVLSLCSNNFCTKVPVAFAQVLTKNSTLKYLNFVYNNSNVFGAETTKSLADIESILRMSEPDRIFLALRHDGNVISVDCTALFSSQSFASEKARQLGESLQGNAVVTELTMVLDSTWTERDIDGDLSLLLRYVGQSNVLSKLTYILPPSDNVDWRVIKFFLAAVANRQNPIALKLTMDVRWLIGHANVEQFGMLLHNEKNCLKEMTFVNNGRFSNGLNGVFESDQFVSALNNNTTLWSLNLGVALPCRKFLIAWKRSARQSRLQVFSVQVNGLDTLVQLFDTLPALVYLKEFRLELVGAAVIEAWQTGQRQAEWLSALSRNGSLQKVELLINGVRLQLPLQVQLLCRRNEMMSRQMAEASEHKTVNANQSGRAGGIPPLSCYPKLLHQSLQCGTVGHSWMLRGLVSLGDSVDPATSFHKKRKPGDDHQKSKKKAKRF